MRKCMEQIRILLQAKAPCIWVNTYEEKEFIDDLKQLMEKDPALITRGLFSWSIGEGMKKLSINKYEKDEEPIVNSTSDRYLFNQIKSKCDNLEIRDQNIFVLKDFHFVKTETAIRLLRDIKEYNETNYNPIIVVAPVVSLPIEAEKLYTVINYDLLTKEEILKIVINFNKMFSKNKEYISISDKDCEKIATACIGLTKKEIGFLLAKSKVEYHTLSFDTILEQKIQKVKKSGVLDYIVPKYGMEDIGGNAAFKKWFFEEVKESFSDEAREFGIPFPKGYMAVGVPGASKSVSAEAIAKEMGVPLLKFSMSRIMDRLIGQSERKASQAFQIIKACAPCVLLMDEVEKMLGGVSSSNSSDSGVTARVFAQCLDFLNCDDKNVFVVMTSNNVQDLPPEFTRSGRLDAQWYFSLPTKEERVEIFKIHLNKTGKDYSNVDFDEIIKATENYTGAEIKEIVNVAMRKAFTRYKKDKNPNLTTFDLLMASQDIIPISKSSKEKIMALESYCKDRARFSNGTDKTEKTSISKSLKLDSLPVQKESPKKFKCI